MRLLDDGSYVIDEPIDISGEGATDFVFTRGWLLEIIMLSRGEYSFFSDGKHVRSPKNHFGVFYPPFCLVRAFAREFKGRVLGVGSEQPLEGLPASPLLFETEFGEAFSNAREAVEVLKRSPHRQPIDVCTDPSLVSLKAKRLIDENYLIYPSISRIAKRLNISHEHMSRQFKRDYGLSPNAYLHQLRLADASFRLARGEEIIDISQEVGYNDLSRFYSQFRKATHTSPAICRKQVFK